MKLDKFRFARVVAFFVNHGCAMDTNEIEQLDELISFELPAVASGFTRNEIKERLDQMLDHMTNYMHGASGGKIEAIKLYRELTGSGLKESKDIIEKVKGMTVNN